QIDLVLRSPPKSVLPTCVGVSKDAACMVRDALHRSHAGCACIAAKFTQAAPASQPSLRRLRLHRSQVYAGCACIAAKFTQAAPAMGAALLTRGREGPALAIHPGQPTCEPL